MAASGTIQNVRIAGMACAVPSAVVGNDIFVSRFGAEQMEKFEKMVGVRERRFSDAKESTADLAVAAASLLQSKGIWRGDNVDAVLFVSQTPNRMLPATACELQARLGITTDAIAYDINLGCSGFVYGLFSAASLLQMPGVGRVILCGGDTISKLTKYDDPASAPLFGDAGFAVVLEKEEGATPIHFAFKTDGSGSEAISCEYGGHLCMDGMDVFNFTINEVPDLIKETLADCSLSVDQIDYFVLHQANRFVLKQVALAIGTSMRKLPVSMDRYGNTSSASIPLTLCDMKVRDPDLSVKKCLMSGFGVGLSWGTLVMDFNFDTCFGIVETRRADV